MEKKKKDYLTKTLLLQFFVCTVFFLLLFFAQQFNLPFIETLKTTLLFELNKPITTEQVEEAFKKIEAFSENDFILTDYSEEEFNAEVLGEGGEDIEMNDNEINNVSFSKYNLNYKIYNPVINGRVSSEFGERIHPISGTVGIHKGIDLALKEGEPIYAIFDGEVIEASYDQWNGNFIKIRHENNITSIYCHCNEVFVEEGAVLRGGEVIASIGSTGQSTGPHLHFEIRINNVSYNPEYALRDAKNAI